MNINYIESFADVALAQEAATAFVANGADVLTGTAQMVVGATGVAVAEGSRGSAPSPTRRRSGPTSSWPRRSTTGSSRSADHRRTSRLARSAATATR